MSNDVALQADVTAIPSNALVAANYLQGLMKAASADNVAPLAVQQLQDLGSLFHCNGPWAEKLPDLLQRSSSFRLQRLSALVGWMKGDVPSYLSLSAAGRAASLLCFLLCNMIPTEQVGKVLYRLSEKCLPPSKANSSIAQLTRAALCVSAKLHCLGFGNHAAEVATRIRLFFMQSDIPVAPFIMNDIGSDEFIDILEIVSRALRDDTLALHLCGTRSIGWVVSMVLALCPDDVLVDIEGSIIQRGSRDNIHITISAGEPDLKYCLESRVGLASQPTSWVPIKQNTLLPHYQTSMSAAFSRNGCHRSLFTLKLLSCVKDDHNLEDLFQALSNLVLFIASGPNAHRPSGSFEAPICDFLGADWEMITVNYLTATLTPPSLSPAKTFRELVDTLYQTVERIFFPLAFVSCSDIITSGIFRIICFLFVEPSSPMAALFPFWNHLVSDENTPFFRATRIPKDAERPAISSPHEVLWPLKNEPCDLLLSHTGGWSNIHQYLIGNNCLFGLQVNHKLICFSQGGTTVYPHPLEEPKATNPKRVLFHLVDGMLQLSNRHYSGIITETCHFAYGREDWTPTKMWEQMEVQPTSVMPDMEVAMRIHPDVCCGNDVLVLRTELRTSTAVIALDFWNAYEGYWHLSYAAPCSHDRDTKLRWVPSSSTLDRGYRYLTVLDRMTRSTLAPLEAGRSFDGVISLTSKSNIAQFLHCALGAQRAGILYQGDCCLPCAMEQATPKYNGYRGIICGDPCSVVVLPTNNNVMMPYAASVDEGVEMEDLNRA